MLNLLDRYGGKKFLKKVLIDWHEAVVAERDIRHYYINVTPEILLKDQLNYMAFIMSQPDRVYRESPYQSAPLDVQVRASVFDEVMVELRKILTEAGVHRDSVPRMSSQIVEIAEESRAKCLGVLESMRLDNYEADLRRPLAPPCDYGIWDGKKYTRTCK